MPERQPQASPIYSEFNDDADMLELVRAFVDEMPDRITQLEAAWRDHDTATIKTVAHQLKGASAGYGFTVVGQAAAELESAVQSIRSDLASAQSEFDALVDLCRRAAA